MKKRYIIECEMDYEYLKEVGVREIMPDGNKGLYMQLPVWDKTVSGNEYVFEINIPEKEEFSVVSVFGLSLEKIHSILAKVKEYKPEWLEEK
jgi:hypothetical protein